MGSHFSYTDNIENHSFENTSLLVTFLSKADKLGQERNLDFDVMKLKRGSSLSYLYMKIETKDFWELPFLQYEQKKSQN